MAGPPACPCPGSIDGGPPDRTRTGSGEGPLRPRILPEFQKRSPFTLTVRESVPNFELRVESFSRDPIRDAADDFGPPSGLQVAALESIRIRIRSAWRALRRPEAVRPRRR